MLSCVQAYWHCELVIFFVYILKFWLVRNYYYYHYYYYY